MTTNLTVAVSYRIRADVKQHIPTLAQRRGLTEAKLIEALVREEARRCDLDDIDPADSNAALDLLFDEVRKLLEPERGAGAPLNRDAILRVFVEIKNSDALRKIYETAIVPPVSSDLDAEGRRQSVNQQIGRLVKTFLGLQSIKEITLPRGSDNLIRSYTELG